MLLSAEHLSINFGSRQLLSDVNLYLNEGDKTGIIGINGTGKSTLLRVLSGTIEPDEGKITRNPNVQISFLEQNPNMDDEATIIEQVFLSFPAEFRELKEYEAKAMLNRLGIADVDQKIGTLSGGQRKRVALATTLIAPADVLILDEPTNHLDSEMVAWLENWLRKFSGGVIMVTHDRYFLERVVNHIVELSRGKLYHYEANYSKYLELKTQREAMEEATERKRQSILRIEYQWISRGCKARTTKSRERVQRYEALKNQAAPEKDETVQMAAASSRLGKKTIALDNVCKAFDGRTVVNHFSYNILKNDRIGIVGRNGAGKSTLLHLIDGSLQPDSGVVAIGATVKLGHFSQEGRELDLDQRVYDFIHEVAEEVKTNAGTFSASQMMERFLFPPDLQSVPIRALSGGERRRLYLLSVLMAAPNILLLDEPTNDLDVTTLAILEDYLQTFPGPILTVSHDRWFLDKIAGQIFEVGEEGMITRYVGNYTDYAEKRKSEKTPQKTGKQPKSTTTWVKEKKLKFSYKEEREFETIDEDIESLEQAMEHWESEAVQAGSDYVKLQEIEEKKAEITRQLEEKTERWVYLNELKEKIDAQIG